MEISLKASYGFELIFKADNVNISEDIEDRIYQKTEDGKTNYRSCERDISDDSIEQITTLLNDMVYYRKRTFDGTELIENLFAKLPEDKIDKLLLKLKRDYESE